MGKTIMMLALILSQKQQLQLQQQEFKKVRRPTLIVCPMSVLGQWYEELTSRSAGGSLMKAGGLAVLASVAYKAYQDWQAKQAPGASDLKGLPSQPPAGSGFSLEEEKDKEGNELGIALVQAMISAAKSDGHLDGQESTRIQEQIQQLDLSNEDKGFLLDLMAKPADAAAIARLAKTKEQAAELYVASRVAIGEADTPEEKAYLERLVALLDLPQDLVAHLDSQISSVRTTVAAS